MSSDHKNEKKCPDCHQCQVCSENRCRLCRKGGSGGRVSELGTGFTHGDYLKWKRKKALANKQAERREVINEKGCPVRI